MSDSIFNDEMIQMRLVELEYKFPEMTDEEITKKIERIYLEETGEVFPGEITIDRMNSSVIEAEKYTTDAKASAIVISPKESEADVNKEIIFIARGSSAVDWIDNILSNGIGTGGVGYAEDSMRTIQLREHVFDEVNSWVLIKQIFFNK